MAKKVRTRRNKKARGICLVFPPPAAQAGSFHIRLADVVRLVEPSVEDIFVVTGRGGPQGLSPGSKLHFIGGNVTCPNAGDPLLPTILGELRAQMRISRAVMALPADVRLVLCRARSSTVLIPLIVARLRRKRSILLLESRGSELVGRVYGGPLNIGGFILSGIYRAVERATYSLAHRLAVNVPGLLNRPWLAKYGDKVFPYPVPLRFIDPELTISRPLARRQTTVGYIGRMSREKGVLNLVKAIPMVCSHISGARFLLGGDGPLLGQVREELADLIAQDRVGVPGWIPHDELPGYLNDMKLLVLPSYYEGLPTILLEAMACGTPVLSTRVGAVPDIITDGETGFIMEDNSPDCIARSIIRALDQANLDRVSTSAHALVESEFRYETVKQRWHKILAGLTSHQVNGQMPGSRR